MNFSCATLGASEHLLASTLVELLFRIALTTPGPVPVLLALDELASIARYISPSLISIVTVARSLRLRLLACTQFLDGIPTDLLNAILGNCGVKIFGGLGGPDARIIANNLAVGSKEYLERFTLSSTTSDPLCNPLHWSLPLRSADGFQLQLNESAWLDLLCFGKTGPEQVAYVTEIAALSGHPGLYLNCPISGRPVALEEYTSSLPEGSFRIACPELCLKVTFPRPKITGVSKATDSDIARQYARILQDLEVQHAVVSVASKPPQIIKVADMTPPLVDPKALDRYVKAIHDSKGQKTSALELIERREEGVKRVIHGSSEKGSPKGATRTPDTQFANTVHTLDLITPGQSKEEDDDDSL